jgi:hypothetical protein
MLITQQLMFDGRHRGNGTGSKPGAYAVIRAATMVTDYGNLKLYAAGQVVVGETRQRPPEWAAWKTPVPTIRWVKLFISNRQYRVSVLIDIYV